MSIRWRFTALFLVMASLSLLFFWVGHSAQIRPAGIVTDWGVIALSLLLPAGIVYFYADKLSRRMEKLYRTTLGMVHGTYEPVDLPDSSDETAQLAKNVSDLARQFEFKTQHSTLENHKMEAILTGMQEGVIALDHVGRIMLINSAAERMFQCSAAMAGEKYLMKVVYHPEVEQLVRQVLKGDPSGELEITLQNRTLMIQVNPISGGKEGSRGAVLVSRDVTELRHLEKVRTDFVANVSHELRTPITSIKGFVETLLDGAAESPELRERFLKIIDGETLRLQRLIEDLLTLTRIEHRGGMTREIPAGARVEDAFEKIRPVIQSYTMSKGLNLEVIFPADLPALALGEDLLSQVLLNLMENAVKYTEEGRIWLAASLEGDYVLLEFGDTGCGIPQDSLNRIFERFYRVDKARSREQGGTGLGLSIVKHIIEGVGGKIEVKSEVGKGSVFTCFIPRI